MREERPWGKATLIWILLAALVVPGAMLALDGFRSREVTDLAGPRREAAAEAGSRPLGEEGRAAAEASGLLSELAALRVAVEGERARLGSYRQAQGELTTTITGLRQEVSALERRRKELGREAAETGSDAAPGGAGTGGSEGGPAEAALPAPPIPPAQAGSGPSGQPVAAAGGGGPRAQGDTEPEMPEIVIRHRAGSATARRAAELVAGEVRKAGLGEVQVQTARQVPRMRTLRYFREEDAPAGEMVAARLRARWNHDWTVQASSRADEAGAARDVLEIWLPH